VGRVFADSFGKTRIERKYCRIIDSDFLKLYEKKQEAFEKKRKSPYNSIQVSFPVLLANEASKMLKFPRTS
jgi:hypothetical protein